LNWVIFLQKTVSYFRPQNTFGIALTNPLKNILTPIEGLQSIRDIQLPAGLKFVQLVVTGPPGAGKSYYINKIHGWPNEGYLDLTRHGWWRDQTLTYRPREVHLGLPFQGFEESLTVFDKEWVEPEEPPILQLDRIAIPPFSDSLFTTNWRERYIFEFLIPDPKIVYERRQARHSKGYFPVDDNLSLKMVEQQVAVYREIALYLHRAKMQVYIREDIDKPPMRIMEKGDVNVPGWAIAKSFDRPSLRTLAGWKWLILRRDPTNWFTVTEKFQSIREECCIAHDGKTFEMRLGNERLLFHPEIPIGLKKKAIVKNWLITTPEACTEKKICGFARVKVGEHVMIGKSNKTYDNIFNFSKSVAPRHVTVHNQNGDLCITPLTDRNNVKIVRYEDIDIREQVETNRYEGLIKIREMFGGPIGILDPDESISLIKNANDLLEKESFRELNRLEKKGGLLEIPNKLTPIIVGDLHANVDNLLKILSENCLLRYLKANSSALIFLGDAVHSEIESEMEDMDSAVLIMDLIMKLKCSFPDNVFYLRGNHDSFSPDISKNGISQGVLFREHLLKLRGEAYVKEMSRFHELLPYVAISDSFVCCHGGPSSKKITRDKLINIYNHPKIRHAILTDRIKKPNSLTGYAKSDVKRFRKGLGLSKNTSFIVGHTPLDPFGSIWQNVGTIKGHHIVYSGHINGPALIIGVGKKMIPLKYPAEPLQKIINKIKM